MVAWITKLVASPVLKGIAPFLKYIAIGGGVMLAGWFVWNKIDAHFKDYNTLIANQAKLQAAELANMDVIAALNENIKILQQSNKEKADAIARQQIVIEKANEYKDDVEEILAKHNLDKLMAAKPGLVANAFNRGTDEYFRMLEARTKALSDYYNTTIINMSGTVKISPTEAAEAPSR